MNHILTDSIKLIANGWELSVNKSPSHPEANVGDLVKIIIHALSPADYESDEPVRSVIEETLWLKIDGQTEEDYRGMIKSPPTHPLQLKDGTSFKLGDTLSFKPHHIFAVRPPLSKPATTNEG